uniref:NAD(P)H dehydrogenase (quinone) n=1 Tax=Ananas comosus var. bracteatus TaxID=296719 RepID=A0A6V7QA10_ANACO|nr:unnamed protein product [Ananas comosus var. bracteatus]
MKNNLVSWRPPPEGWVKLNADGSFVSRDSNGGAGFVARDCNGHFLFAGASDCRGVDPLYSELCGIRSALTEAKNAGLPRVILESDSSSAVHLVGGVSARMRPGVETVGAAVKSDRARERHGGGGVVFSGDGGGEGGDEALLRREGGGALRLAPPGSFNRGLLRAAVEICEGSIEGLEIEMVEIAPLPLINTDLEVGGAYPPAVEEFRAKILAADCVLFASPEYNYSISAPLKNAVDWASRPRTAGPGSPLPL